MDVRRWSRYLPALLVGAIIGMGGLWGFQQISKPSFTPTASLTSTLRLEIQDGDGEPISPGKGYTRS